MEVIKMDKSLLPEEQEIESMDLKPVSKSKKNKIDSLLSEAKKNKAISLRISGFDLDLIKKKAEQDGIPYQTLINSVLHKYVTNQLFEKDEVLKTVSAIRTAGGI